MISEVRAASRGIYGAPKVFQELRKAGVRTSRKRVARIMRESGWAGTTRGCARRPKGGAKQAAPQPCAAPDLVRREFGADGPDRPWFADITYVRTHQGWLCLAVAMESFALFHNAKVLGKRAACLLTISDSFVSPEITTPEQRQTSFTAMMRVALAAPAYLENA